MINKNSKIFIAGHKGMIGSAILRRLKKSKYKNLFYQTRKELDLTDQKKVNNYLKKIKPMAVIIAAAKVGGIKANSDYPLGYFGWYDQGNYLSQLKNLIINGLSGLSSGVYPPGYMVLATPIALILFRILSTLDIYLTLSLD